MVVLEGIIHYNHYSTIITGDSI
ncbi:hypothetical protein S140_30 [Shewanella sp. phage 1/40]|nr:hypothetical protein S140_30 [Shewanella sp. phage 1/40]AHK11440.1 hypothetical protein S140_30 [Shewanella sp. phage 1/40]